MNQSNPHNYQIPDGLRVYAIGDVHGHLDLLKALQDKIVEDLLRDAPGEAHIVYLGDYVDRGPDSAGVIEFLMARRDRGDGIDKTFIRGNHEDGMFQFMTEPLNAAWLKWGGVETLASYGIDVEDADALSAGEKEELSQELRRVIPAAHVDFMRACVSSVVIGDYVFAHAGVDPLKPLAEQTHGDFSRTRQPFLGWDKEPNYVPLEKRVVHGHTICAEPTLRPHRVGVDTGAYKHGVLTAAVLERGEVRFLQVSSG